VLEFNETVPETDIRGIRGGSWFWGDVSKFTRPVDMHSSDEFSDLGFRVAKVGDTSQAVPSASAAGLLATLACVAFIGIMALRRRGSLLA
jgi:hypothetical protein